MGRKIPLKAVLGLWRQQEGSPEAMGEHLSASEMYELLVRAQSSESLSSLLGHVQRCSRCLRLLRDLLDAQDQAIAWDCVLPRAASSERVQWSGEIPTKGGKYSIIIRRSLTDSHRGVITLQVGANYRDQLEGSLVLVKDGRGHVLLEGTIINGEVSQTIADVDGIVPRFFVEPVQSPKQ